MHSLLASILLVAKFLLYGWHFLSPKSPLMLGLFGVPKRAATSPLR